MEIFKRQIFLPICMSAFFADCATKWIATEFLNAHTPIWIVRDSIGLLLVYNNRRIWPILVAGAMVMFAVLWSWALWYRRTGRWNWKVAAAMGLLVGGALGNLWDRARWNRGVVDFLLLRLGSHEVIYNVADIARDWGALLLMWHLGSRVTKALRRRTAQGNTAGSRA